MQNLVGRVLVTILGIAIIILVITWVAGIFGLWEE